MCSLVSQLAQEIQKLQAASLCVKCKDSKDLRLLANCSHLVCLSCLNAAASKCPACKVTVRRRDSLYDDYLEEVLTNIQYLNSTNKPDTNNLVNFEQPKVMSLFAPECTTNKRDHRGETRLHKDCRDGNLDKVKTLLEAGVDVNVQDFAGWTVLHEAVTAHQIKVAELLLDYGAFVSVPGLNYTTPLHTAVKDRNFEMAKLLVEYGADLLCFNKDGKTPVDLCYNSDDMRVVLCLTQRRPFVYRVYTIPHPKVFLINVSNEVSRKLSELRNVSISKERNFLHVGDVTYTIVGNDKPDIKYLQAAMLQGSCIVSTTWINDFVAKKSVVNPLDHLPDIPGYALRKAVMNMFNKLPKLFDGMQFYFHHTNAQKIGGYRYTVDDFKILISLGGGKVMTRRPTGLQELNVCYPYHASKETNLATIVYYLIFDETKPMTTESHSTGMRYKSAKWLIECVNNFTIIA